MIKLLIYDLDGTLIDSCQDIANCVNLALEEFGFPQLPEKKISSFVGKGAKDLLRQVLREINKKEPTENLIEQALYLYRNHYRKHLLDETKLFPSVKEVLEHFKARKQGIISNKSEDFSRQILSGLGILSYFFRIVGGEQAFPKKPSPDAVLDIMKSISVQPHETVLIGDSDIDVQTGKNAGIKTIALTYGYSTQREIEQSEPDLILKSLKDLMSCPLFH